MIAEFICSMRRVFGALSFAALTLAVQAGALACGDYPVRSVRLEDGREIGLYLPEDKLRSAPEWTPGMGEPPLSVSAAVETAMAWGKEKYSQFESVSVREISLTKTSCSRASNWYYTIEFVLFFNGSPLYGSGAFVGIMMDGTVVEPRVEPATR